MEEQLKPEPGGSKLAYFPRTGWMKRVDPWWGLVLVVVLLVVLLVTAQADPFRKAASQRILSSGFQPHFILK